MGLLGPVLDALLGSGKSTTADCWEVWQKSNPMSFCNSLEDVRKACCIPEAKPTSTGMGKG